MTAPLDLDALRALADAATPGPWFTPDSPRLQGAVSSRIGNREVQVASIDGDAAMHDERAAAVDIQRANAGFIAAARTALPTLIDEVRRLRALALKWLDEVDSLQDGKLAKEVEALRRGMRAQRVLHDALDSGLMRRCTDAESARSTAIAERDAARAELAELSARHADVVRMAMDDRDRLAARIGDIADDACGIQPVTSADALLTLIEAKLVEHRIDYNIVVHERASLAAEVEEMRPVVEASIELRRVESTDVPGESIAELVAALAMVAPENATAIEYRRALIDSIRSGLDARHRKLKP